MDEKETRQTNSPFSFFHVYIIMRSSLYLFITFIFIFSGCQNYPDVEFNAFPANEYNKIVAYKMDETHDEIIQNGFLSKDIVGEGMQLSSKQEEEFLKILFDKRSYGEEAASCFDPHIGYVFYDIKNKAVAHVTICLSCSNMRTSPRIGAGILGKLGRSKLYNLEEEIFNN